MSNKKNLFSNEMFDDKRDTSGEMKEINQEFCEDPLAGNFDDRKGLFEEILMKEEIKEEPLEDQSLLPEEDRLNIQEENSIPKSSPETVRKKCLQEKPRRKESSIGQRNSIISLHKSGISASGIAQLQNVNKRTVYRWIKRNEKRGNIENLARSGQPRRTTQQQDDTILNTARQQPLINAVAIKRQTGIKVSDQTIRNRLHKAGLQRTTPAIKPLLSQANREERLGFALQYYQAEESFWKTVVFCDEMHFSSDQHGKLHCWRPDNTRYIAESGHPSCRSSRIRVGLWGWMAASGPGELAVIHDRLTGQQYVDILEEVMLPSVRSMLLPEPQNIHIAMDNSPIHNSSIVNTWFQQHPEVVRIHWPAKSPDLMPIDHLWTNMSWKCVSEAVKNKGHLIHRSYDIWENLRQSDICENLVASLPSRLAKVIDAGGDYTKY